MARLPGLHTNFLLQLLKRQFTLNICYTLTEQHNDMRWFLTIEFKGLNKGTKDKPSSALAAVCFTDMGIYISKHPRYRGTFQRAGCIDQNWMNMISDLFFPTQQKIRRDKY